MPLSSDYSYESATNELPLSAISLNTFPETPTDVQSHKSNFNEFYSSCCALPNGGMTPLATNERPLSCTCLPKLLTDANECYSNCSANDLNAINNEPSSFDGASNVQLSSSDPFPRGNYFEQLETQTFSRNFLERLNDLHNCHDQKSITPRIQLNDYDCDSRIVGIHHSQKKRNESNRCASSESSLTTSNAQYKVPSSHSCQITVTPAVDLIACSTTDNNHVTDIHVNHNTNTRSTRMPINANKIITKCNAVATVVGTASFTNTIVNSIAITTVNPIKLCSTTTTTTTSTNVNNPTIPHPNIVKTHNSDATQTTTTSTTRRQRHSIAGQMGFFKIIDIAGGFSRKMTTSTNSLFSTAVISGSSSAPNLRDMIPNTASPSGRNQFEAHLISLIFRKTEILCQHKHQHQQQQQTFSRK